MCSARRRGTAAAVLLFHRDGSFSALGEANWFYMLGGVLGLVITLTVMLGMHSLTPATAVSVILVSQLLTAGAIDALGLMGTEKVPLTWTKAAGAALMIAGKWWFSNAESKKLCIIFTELC